MVFRASGDVGGEGSALTPSAQSRSASQDEDDLPAVDIDRDELAASLHLSRKGVEYHVTALLRQARRTGTDLAYALYCYALFGLVAPVFYALILLAPGVERARALLALDRIRDAFKDFLKAHEIDRTYPKPTLHEEDGDIPTKVAKSPAPTIVPSYA